MGREKWGEKSGARKVERRKVGREKWGDKSGGREKWGEKVGCEKWGTKSGARKVGREEKSGARKQVGLESWA